MCISASYWYYHKNHSSGRTKPSTQLYRFISHISISHSSQYRDPNYLNWCLWLPCQKTYSTKLRALYNCHWKNILSDISKHLSLSGALLTQWCEAWHFLRISTSEAWLHFFHEGDKLHVFAVRELNVKSISLRRQI